MLLLSCNLIRNEGEKELAALRIEGSTLSKTLTLTCGEIVGLGDLGHAVEVRASFTAGAAQGVSFGVTVLGSADGQEITVSTQVICRCS